MSNQPSNVAEAVKMHTYRTHIRFTEKALAAIGMRMGRLPGNPPPDRVVGYIADPCGSRPVFAEEVEQVWNDQRIIDYRKGAGFYRAHGGLTGNSTTTIRVLDLAEKLMGPVTEEARVDNGSVICGAPTILSGGK